MAESNEMSKPVTRAELTKYPTQEQLLEELAKYSRNEQLADYATKRDLETWGGALYLEIQRLGVELRGEIGAFAQRLEAEMSRLLQAAVEQFQRSIGIFDERA